MAEVIRIEPSLFRPSEEAWFVMSDGRRLLRKITPPDPVARSDFPAPSIRRDAIEPCRGADGKVYDSLSAYRRTLLPQNNPRGERYYELGNDTIPVETPKTDRKAIRDAVKAGIEDVRNGRVPPLVSGPPGAD